MSTSNTTNIILSQQHEETTTNINIIREKWMDHSQKTNHHVHQFSSQSTKTTTTTIFEKEKVSKPPSSFRVHSLRQNYSKDLLTRFYNEHMIPHFPIEDERDSLEDWIYCLDPVEIQASMQTNYEQSKRWPVMDILLLLYYDENVSDENDNDDGDNGGDNKSNVTQEPMILAGVAFEYYQQAEIGLVSYVTVHRLFRKLGIMKWLHPLAIQALQDLHLSSSSSSSSVIKAIFAETNTVHAKEENITQEDILNRHRSLYGLGYRLIQYPYSQPPLGTDQAAFDDVMLLVYCGRGGGEEKDRNTNTAITGECETQRNDTSYEHCNNDGGNWFGDYNGRIPSIIIHGFIVDFFMSVFGYPIPNSTTTTTDVTTINTNTSHKDWESNSNDVDVKSKPDIEKDNDGDKIICFKHHPCYKLSKWFCDNHPYATIQPDLPWRDVTADCQRAYDDHQQQDEQQQGEEDCETNIINTHKSSTPNKPIHHHQQHQQQHAVIGIIGAGAAGLSAAIHIAKNATFPVIVKLIEANDFVGGRIRTIITTSTSTKMNNNNNKDNDSTNLNIDTTPNTKNRRYNQQYMGKEIADQFQAFAPWPVPIGAEFIHGVNSVVNDMIEEEGWKVEETFDLCTADEYPTDNTFTRRELTTLLLDEQRKSPLVKVFGDGKCWDLKYQRPSSDYGDGERYGMLIQKANEIWDDIYSLGISMNNDDENNHEIPPIPLDMSLSKFVEQKMKCSSKDDVETVKSIIDAIYAKTAGSSVNKYGVNEGCREELNWDYTESNFRTKECFAEIIHHYLQQIESINMRYKTGESKGMIELIKSTPIIKVGNGTQQSKVVLLSKNGTEYICDKVIVAVPLGVLKAGDILFCDEYSLPTEKQLAIEKINFYSGMKVHMLLQKSNKELHEFSGLLQNTELFFCPGEIFCQIWVRRNTESIFLTGFVVADGRNQLLSEIEKNHKTSQELFMNQLQRMFAHEIEHYDCTAFDLHDWSDDEFVMGLYSSPSVNAGWKTSKCCNEGKVLKTMRDDMKAPINNSIYFAGEHTNVKTCATVQAAIESGIIAAVEIVKSLKR